MSTIQYVNKYFVLVEDDGTVKMLFDLREPIKNYSQIPMLYDDTKDINAFKVINKLQSDHIKYYGDDHLMDYAVMDFLMVQKLMKYVKGGPSLDISIVGFDEIMKAHIKSLIAIYEADVHLFEGDALKGSVVYIYERGSENIVENGDDVFRPSLDSRITVKRMDGTKKSDIIDYGQWEEHISTVKGLLKDKGTKEEYQKWTRILEEDIKACCNENNRYMKAILCNLEEDLFKELVKIKYF